MQIKQVMFEKVGLSSKMFAFSPGILDNSSLKDVSPGRQLGAYCMYGDLQKKKRKKKKKHHTNADKQTAKKAQCNFNIAETARTTRNKVYSGPCCAASSGS